MIPRVFFLAAVLALTAGPHLAAGPIAKLERFQLENERGQAAAIVPSAQATLIYMYRGDW